MLRDLELRRWPLTFYRAVQLSVEEQRISGLKLSEAAIGKTVIRTLPLTEVSARRLL
jgi:hypothetical protein